MHDGQQEEADIHAPCNDADQTHDSTDNGNKVVPH